MAGSGAADSFVKRHPPRGYGSEGHRPLVYGSGDHMSLENDEVQNTSGGRRLARTEY